MHCKNAWVRKQKSWQITFSYNVKHHFLLNWSLWKRYVFSQKVIFLFSFNEHGCLSMVPYGQLWRPFYLQSCIPGAVTLLVSPRCHAYTFVSNNDRFVLSPWLIISLAPCCERSPAYSQLVSDAAVMFLSLHVFGLWKLSWTLHAPYWRHVSTYLIETWFAPSFLFDLHEV